MKFLSKKATTLCVVVMITLFFILITTPLSTPTSAFAQSSDFTVGDYSLISRQRVDRTTYEYTFVANATNNGPENAANVTAKLTSLASTVSVVDGSLDFGDIQAWASTTSTDTFTIRVNRLYRFNEADLSWEIQYDNNDNTELEIIMPISDPPVLLAGKTTSVTISVFVSASHVELLRRNGDNFIQVGEMKDDGQNGDQTAGDKVYTIQTTINESEADHVDFRIRVLTSDNEKTQDITISVINIPSTVTDAELNLMASDLYQIGLETQALMTAMNIDLDNIPLGTIEQIGENLRVMFINFETITKQDFWGLFSLAKKSESISQLYDIFSKNPSDPRVSEIKEAVINSGITAGEVEKLSKECREGNKGSCDVLILNARTYYMFNSATYPDAEGVQLLKAAQRVTIKSLFSEPTSLIGNGISGIVDLKLIGSILVDELSNAVTGIIVDWYIDDNGEENILIGETENNEEFTVPSGTHNILYSFGEDIPRAVVNNILVFPQQTTIVKFSPYEEKQAMEVNACGYYWGSNLNGNSNMYGNSFIPNQSNISSIAVKLYVFNLTGGTNCGDVSLRLCSDLSCNNVLAISYLDSNLLPAVQTYPQTFAEYRDWVKFSFKKPVAVDTTTSYYFYYSTEGCRWHNICNDLGDPYSDGRLIGMYQDPPNRDTSFRVYYRVYYKDLPKLY